MKKFEFKETIKAAESYRILKTKDNPRITAMLAHLLLNDFQDVFLLDGNNFIMFAELKSFEDFKDECLNGNNEAACIQEMFITKKGNKFIYWRDEERDDDYLTKYEAQNELEAVKTP